MDSTPNKYVDDSAGSVACSEEHAKEAENERLLHQFPLSSSDLPLRREKNHSRLYPFFLTLLVMSNAILLGFLFIVRQPKNANTHKSWLPPELQRTEIFTAHTIYGDPPSTEVQKAWDDMMPLGRGFVVINNDTVLPEQPRLNQSMAEQHAMISVFHQLHCLYMTREAYYDARAGNIDKLNHIHMSHCWDYLRQAIMCFSDTSLEWIPAPPNDKGSTGWGYQHTCRDFGAIYSWAEENRVGSGTGIH